KAAVAHMTRLAGADLGEHNIRVNAISPGAVATPIFWGGSQRAQTLNLVAPKWPMEDRFDAIFCRNVMIYFDKGTQARILDRFAPLLKHDGLLFAGHADRFSYIRARVRLRGQTVYTLADR
ncbi:MAG: SDR family oxidoreductase, partial [Alphaproteobacteria bacterium]